MVEDMARIGDREQTMKGIVVVVEWDSEILEVEDPILILTWVMDRLLCVTVEWKLYREQFRRQDRIREGNSLPVQSQGTISVASLSGQMMYHRVMSSLLPPAGGDLEVGDVVEAMEGGPVGPHWARCQQVLGLQRALLVKREPLPLVVYVDSRDTPNAHALRLSNYHDANHCPHHSLLFIVALLYIQIAQHNRS